MTMVFSHSLDLPFKSDLRRETVRKRRARKEPISRCRDDDAKRVSVSNSITICQGGVTPRAMMEKTVAPRQRKKITGLTDDIAHLTLLAKRCLALRLRTQNATKQATLQKEERRRDLVANFGVNLPPRPKLHSAAAAAERDRFSCQTDNSGNFPHFLLVLVSKCAKVHQSSMSIWYVFAALDYVIRISARGVALSLRRREYIRVESAAAAAAVEDGQIALFRSCSRFYWRRSSDRGNGNFSTGIILPKPQF
jgi:hypothetical protein